MEPPALSSSTESSTRSASIDQLDCSRNALLAVLLPASLSAQIEVWEAVLVASTLSSILRSVDLHFPCGLPFLCGVVSRDFL
jgi:Mor family transcriptional regulator